MPIFKSNNESIQKRLKISSDIILLCYDIVTVAIAYFLALLFRFDLRFSQIPDEYYIPYLKFIPVYLGIVVSVYSLFGLYKSIWKYASSVELSGIIYANAITGTLHILLITLLLQRMPISYYVMGIMFQFFFAVAVRFAYRFVRLISKLRGVNKSTAERVMIIGAGDAGRAIINEMIQSDELNEQPVCIIDDDSAKLHKIIDKVPVVGGRNDILTKVEQYKIEKIYLAIPSASKQEIRDILNICKETSCELKTLPGTYQLIKGEVSLKELKDVAIEDLLGRDQVKVNMDEIYRQISGKTVLITGGGGSIGSEIALQVSRHNPKKLVIFDIYENNAYEIQHKILKENPHCPLEVLIGSVRDSRRVNDIFKTYRPDIVYHTAAHKHVPLMEDSPCEAVKNNVIGTYKTAYAAMMYGTRRFVLISTDKAVNPTNVMGASKRLCELVIQSFDKYIKANRESELPALHVHKEDEGSMYPLAEGAQRFDANGNPVFTLPGNDDQGYRKAQTEFIAVRFGNVLGSHGSVVPLFKDQIASGGPVTVTHPDIIRYFMTIPEAASLVLQAGAYANGGEIFVLDMGEPVKIDDLARNLIKLTGLEPEKDIRIEYTGLRPGEKLYEEKLMSEEGLMKTPNELIHIGKPVEFDEKKFINSMTDLMLVSYSNTEAIRLLIEQMVSTFHPSQALTEEERTKYQSELDVILQKQTKIAQETVSTILQGTN